MIKKQISAAESMIAIMFSQQINLQNGGERMGSNNVKERVLKVIAEVLKIDAAEIADDANFVFDLGADSMQSLELVAGFEEEFDLEMDETKALEIQNVNDAITFISNQLK
jgi:acyl carrier protein